MPKVDPQSGEPISDAPDGPVENRGGKMAGDPGMEGATEIGRQGAGKSDTSDWSDDDNTSRELPAEKGGAASGGAT